jgi:AcrR family transcriptional regulator
MKAISTKQQEILDRERNILEFARQHLLSSGYHGLTLEFIASELGVSRGTLYLHFPCREEILLSLLLEAAEHRRKMFDRAATFRAPPRIRILAIAASTSLFLQLHPEYPLIEQILQSDCPPDRLSAERRARLMTCQLLTDTMITGIVRDASSQGQLQLSAELTAEQVAFCFSTWLAGFSGALRVCESLPWPGSSPSFGVPDPRLTLFAATERLLDGFLWLPLSSVPDSTWSPQDILRELFPDQLHTKSRTG